MAQRVNQCYKWIIILVSALFAILLIFHVLQLRDRPGTQTINYVYAGIGIIVAVLTCIGALIENQCLVQIGVMGCTSLFVGIIILVIVAMIDKKPTEEFVYLGIALLLVAFLLFMMYTLMYELN